MPIVEKYRDQGKVIHIDSSQPVNQVYDCVRNELKLEPANKPDVYFVLG